MGISRQDRPQMFRRVIFDHGPEVRDGDVAHDDAPAPAPPQPQPRRAVQRWTLSIVRRPTTTTRDPE